MLVRLFLAGAMGFGIGIAWATLASLPLAAAGFLFLLGILFALMWQSSPRALYAYMSAVLLLAALGAGRVWMLPDGLPSSLSEKIGTEISIEGKVVADPDLRETTQRIVIETDDARILVVAPLYPKVTYGERIRAEGRLARPEPFATDGGRVFRYDRFLEKDGVFSIIERAAIEPIAPRNEAWTQVRGFFADLKSAFLAALAAALPEPHAALAGGLVAGGKQGLGTHLLDAFIVSGLVHIVVLSGYNVMIVAESVMRMLSVFPRRVAASAAALTIGAFVLAAGAGAASIRAGLMAGIALFARATYRTYDALRALLLAGALMLLWNPLLLLYDPGFQLSFVATLGLILGAPLVERLLQGVPNEFFRDIMASTIAAQIAVLPLLLYQNGLFSLVALPANLLVLPVVPLAMAGSAIAGVLGGLLPSIAPVLGLPAYALLEYIIKVVQWTSALPLSSINIPAFPFGIVVVAYGALGYLLWQHRALIDVPRASARLQRSS